MFLRKHYAVVWFPWRHSEGHHEEYCIDTTVFVNMFESLSVPGKFNIYLRERYSVTCNIYWLSKTKCHNSVATNTATYAYAFQGHKKD